MATGSDPGAEVALRGLPSPDVATARVLTELHERSASVAYAHIFSTPFPRDDALHRWSRYTGRVVVACDGTDPLGFVAWDGAELDALYVLPEAAGRGVGGALLASAEGTDRLWVLEANAHARSFYARRGWRATGESRVDDGARELRYQRP